MSQEAEIKHVLDWTRNPKQAELLNLVMMAAVGTSPVRQIVACGGIRSGKTFAFLGCITILCLAYPGSKWIVFRKDFPSLEKTTIPDMQMLVPHWRWSRSPGNYYCEAPNGSRVYFYGENAPQDPQHKAFLGLKVNGVLLEQMEELTESLYKDIQARLGTNLLEKMPSPLLMGTSNPTQDWPKREFFEPWRTGSLDKRKAYIMMNPVDNPYNTQEQWAAWGDMDERRRRTFIDGDWTDFGTDNRFAYAFDRTRHLTMGLQPDPSVHLWLSFDFNVSPMSCLVCQIVEGKLRFLESIKLNNSDVFKMCEYIRVKYDLKKYMVRVTGDSSGQSRTAAVRDNMSYYRIIQRELLLPDAAFKLQSHNPNLADNSVLVNTVLERLDIQIDKDRCKELVWDLENARVNPDGTLRKQDRNDPAQQCDLLDCFRYFVNETMRHVVVLPSKQFAR